MATTEVQPEQGDGLCYAVEYPGGRRQLHGAGTPAFTLSFADESQLRRILCADDYSAAMAFVRGEFDVRGNLIAALRFKQEYSKRNLPHHFWKLAAGIAPVRVETWFQSRKRAADNVRFHYDVSNEFYRNFLDSRMVYSEGHFEAPSWSLDEAQQAKLDGICKALDLRPGESLLDVGCGWGGLLIHAAQHYQVDALGCTLSRRQCEYARSAIAEHGLEGHAAVREVDYRDISRQFDKIASIGMFEHVGRRRLGKYFRKIYGLLKPGGLFLNSGITRPQTVGNDPQTWFLLRRVFPGGELAHLSDVVRYAEAAGFRILDIRSYREHYARTCELWVERLQQKSASCLSLVSEVTYRTWLLYLAASALSFEAGQTDVFSLLMSKPGTRFSHHLNFCHIIK